MQTVPYIPETAPFSNEQRAWLNGLLAGLFSETSSQSVSSNQPSPVLTILYGSQSGTAATLAKKISKQCQSAGLQPKVVDLENFEPTQLGEVSRLLLVTSTYGDGEPPDNAKQFYRFMHSAAAAELNLEKVRFAVLGLGDKSYPEFNKCAKDFQQSLAKSGAREVHPALYCDVEFEPAVHGWLPHVLKAMSGSTMSGAGAIPAPVTVTSSAKSESATAEKAAYSRKHPYRAKVLLNYNLNGKGSAKTTHHVVLALGNSGLCYQAGDALGVMPTNDHRLVEKILRQTGLSEDAPTLLTDGSTGALYDALLNHYDIHRLSSAFVEACVRQGASSAFKLKVTTPSAVDAYVQGRTLLDALCDSEAQFADTELLIAPLRKLQPRLYSISSSPLAHPGEVHVTVGRVQWQQNGKTMLGVCSNFLAAKQRGSVIPVFIHPNHQFRPPTQPDVAMIMVGPGTGIAPFRSFLYERAQLGHSGYNWLFFGDQHEHCDFLYQDELKELLQKGVLSRLDTAFSRDQNTKIYVQQRMLENSRELYFHLQNGAYFYVCGDARHMAKDVDAALHQIICRERNCTNEEATAYVENLRCEKRYQRDVY
ncbi:MAG: flavodoxin domain-containing protein [Verrucomicrobia bacterium]|nr:flavodoxin domain-containing protein [Verrucomicrobiota bacterium]